MGVREKNEQPDPEAQAAADLTRQAPYRWISAVEDLCRKAFLPDVEHLERCRARVRARSDHAAGVEVRADGGKREPIGLGEAIHNPRERSLTTDEESLARQMAQGRIDRRDLLASRIGRESVTKRWQACASDAYNLGGPAYRRRLATIGMALAELGWLTEPPHNPWRHAPRATTAMSDATRNQDAEATAAGWVG